jgi:hypothetical protein
MDDRAERPLARKRMQTVNVRKVRVFDIRLTWACNNIKPRDAPALIAQPPGDGASDQTRRPRDENRFTFHDSNLSE